MSTFPVARTSIIFSALCAGFFPVAQSGAQPRLVFHEYKTLYDGQSLGYRANAAAAVLVDGTLDLVFTGALDD
ncbi:MAG TPA: hypothetical protein VG672_26290, partial [Bryobacteraceae bacterium]|nr:hypothetical protein [Bryobacteraceae bacterium]